MLKRRLVHLLAALAAAALLLPVAAGAKPGKAKHKRGTATEAPAKRDKQSRRQGKVKFDVLNFKGVVTAVGSDTDGDGEDDAEGGSSAEDDGSPGAAEGDDPPAGGDEGDPPTDGDDDGADGGDVRVLVTHGNSRARSYVGQEVAFDIDGAKVQVLTGDGMRVGDEVHVQVRLPRGGEAEQPFAARKFLVLPRSAVGEDGDGEDADDDDAADSPEGDASDDGDDDDGEAGDADADDDDDDGGGKGKGRKRGHGKK